jgi:hypothetical protein
MSYRSVFLCLLSTKVELITLTQKKMLRYVTLRYVTLRYVTLRYDWSGKQALETLFPAFREQFLLKHNLTNNVNDYNFIVNPENHKYSWSDMTRWIIFKCLWNCGNIWDAITHGYTHEILTFQAAGNRVSSPTSVTEKNSIRNLISFFELKVFLACFNFFTKILTESTNLTRS